MPPPGPTPVPAAGQARTRLTTPELERSLDLSVADGLAAVPIIALSASTNVFVTALITQLVVVPTETIGYLAALPFAGSFLQIGITPLVMRWCSPWAVALGAGVGHLLTWVSLLFILPLLPAADPVTASSWILGWAFVKCLLSAVSSVGWNVWMRGWVPMRIRGKFFGRRNGVLQVATLAFLPTAGWILSHWHCSVGAFQAVVLIAILFRVFSLAMIWMSPARINRPQAGPAPSLPSQLRLLGSCPPLLLFIAFGALWAFASSCFGAFYQVFMFKSLGYSAWDVSVFSTLSRLSGVLSLVAWGRLIDRHGNKSVMAISLIMGQTLNFLWCFLTPQNRPLLYVLWVWTGATGSGVLLGQLTLLLKVIPERAKDTAIAVNIAVTSLFAAIGPVLGSRLLEHALRTGPSPLAAYHGCFLLQPVLGLLSAFIVLRIREQSASGLPAVALSLREPRTLRGVLGLSLSLRPVGGLLIDGWAFLRGHRREAARSGAAR